MSGAALHRTFSFANVPVGASPPASSSGTSTAGGAQDSLLTRIFVAPILVVSFIVSLLIIDNDTSSSIIQKPGVGRSGSKNGKEKGREGYYHSHQKKLMKQEMDDAFRLRNRVILVICVLSALILAVVSWFGMRLLNFMGYHVASSYLFGHWKRNAAT